MRSFVITSFVLALLSVAGCSSNDTGKTSNPTPKTTPPTAQAPTPATPTAKGPVGEATCDSLPSLDAQATEILVESIKSQSPSNYHLALSQTHTEIEFIPEHVTTQNMISIKVSPLANPEDADSLVTVDCKQMTGAPDGNMNGTLKAPVQISTNDLSLNGGITVDYKLYGKSVGRADVLDKSSYRSFGYSNLKNLKDALTSNGETHLYRVNDTQIELRSTQVSDNGKMRYTITSRTVFDLVP